MINPNDFEVDTGKPAKYNAGVLHTQRINKILDMINFCKYVPLSKNQEYGMEWNFVLWFNGINNLYDEVDAFVGEDERKKALRLRKSANHFIDEHPVIIMKNKINPGRREEQIDALAWKTLKHHLEDYERFVKMLGVKYQIISTTAEDDEGL